jgi:uncharacterized protein YndB with AHSA1/START domain
MTSNREFVHARLIAAPPADVFRAFSNPVRLAQWWGPHGFSSTFDECDFRPGGHWRFVLHGPDGAQYPNHNIFRDVVPDACIVIDHQDANHHFVLTATLAQERGGTRVEWRQRFDTVEEHDRVAPFVTPANEQCLQRLEAASLPPRVRPWEEIRAAADAAVARFKAKQPLETDCPACELPVSVRSTESADAFDIACPCGACRCSRPGRG